MKRYRKIMVFGTFDILHPGHINFLEQAKKYGNYLIVVLARDENVKKIKGFFPRLDERARKKIVEALEMTDKVIYGDKKDYFKKIAENKPDIICLGYDQKIPNNFKEELKKRGVVTKIIRMKAYKPKRYKSSIIIKHKATQAVILNAVKDLGRMPASAGDSSFHSE